MNTTVVTRVRRYAEKTEQRVARHGRVLLLAAAVAAIGCAGEERSPDEAQQVQAVQTASTDWAAGPYVPWQQKRAARQAELDAYLAQNREALQWFLYKPVGSIGIPTALLHEFPVLFPDIWGKPEEKMAPQGFGPDPYNPLNPIPFGLGTAFMQPGVEIATVTCGGCHVGRVIGPDGKVHHLIGAPNHQFNQLRTAVEDTVKDPRWDTYYAGNPVGTAFKKKVLEKRNLIDITLGAYTFNPARVPNAPYLHDRNKPGHLDAIGVALHVLTVPEIYDPALADAIREAVLPPYPAQVDIMSTWRQGVRPRAQWDGSIKSGLYRNLAAEVGVISDPSKVDFQNARITTGLMDGLPPPPYPFAVDDARAQRGQQLYAQHCASCHFDNNDRLYSPKLTRTDPNRVLTISEEGRRRAIAVLRAACTDPTVCDVPDEDIIHDVSSSGKLGYVAPPLDGIWARAPYLHNGSVPTLHHLLVPRERPAKFIRGNAYYDERKVGFAWDAAAALTPNTHWFDTSEAGASSAGHDTLGFNGLDWSKEPEKLQDLLEFLKTL